MKIEINNNQLMIYFFNVLNIQGKGFKFPRVLYNKAIPYYVDVNQITATQDGNSLVVTLPFNELANGRHRDIPIGN